MKIKFCGAAGTVTGSCYYVIAAGRKFLIDCGLFQGKDETLNSEDFPFSPSELDFVIVTHAHIDHTGRLPILVKKEFNGSIFCTCATSELVTIMLKDSGHIHEMDAKWENKKRLRKGLEPIAPLYTSEDAGRVTEFLEKVSYDEPYIIDENISFVFRDAGHLLGSAIVELYIKDDGKNLKLVFSGDLGNHNIPIIKDYEYVNDADYLIIESTYGNRLHQTQMETINLADIIVNTISQGGNVVIPSFAVGRAQEILYILNHYIDVEKRRTIKDIQVYLDSPLAQQTTEVFGKHIECYDQDAIKELTIDGNPLNFNNLFFTSSPEDSMALNDKHGIVIISSSGMCEAGRIKHHLKYNLWKKNSSIVFVGFQAEGTLGRKILDGEKNVKIFGEDIHVAANIYNIQGLSGHADLNGLINWVKHFEGGIRKNIFITHGDPDASTNLKEVLSDITSTKCVIPKLNEEYIL